MSASPPPVELPASLKLAFDGFDDGILVQDTAGRVLFANDLAAQMAGLENSAQLLASTPKQLMERLDLFDPSGAQFSWAQVPGRLAMAGETPEPQLLRVIVRDTGRERWVVVRAQPLRDPRGRFEYVVTFFRDVTERRRQEEEGRVAQEWFSTTLSSIGDAVIATDQSGRIQFLNPKAEALTGWSSKEACGQPLRRVFAILDEATRMPPPTTPVERVLEAGQVVRLPRPTILVRKNGSELNVDDSAAPIRDAAGRVVGVVLVFRDVSARRREDLRRAFLSQAVEKLNSSLDYESTLATVARLAVPGIADWCAVDLVEPEGVKRLAVAHVDPDKLQLVRDIERKYPPDPNAMTGVPKVLRDGVPELVEDIPEEMLRAAAVDEDHWKLIEALCLRSYIAVPIRLGSEIIGVISLAQAESNRRYNKFDLDLATALAERAAVAIEHARLFRAVEASRQQERAANRSKDEFLAMLGHELRNPLAPMVTAMEIMAMKGGDTFKQERAVLDRQLRHMIRLVDDLLDVSRIAQGKVELHFEIVDLAAVLDQALEMVSPLIQRRNHQIVVHKQTECFVRGDPSRLAQIISNVLNNAAKYTDPGGSIQLKVERRDRDIVVSVRDNGTGVAPSMLPRIFDTFVQERQESDRGSGGLGLGLAIVRSLVQLHGGTVHAESAGLGHGTTVEVRFPAARKTSSSSQFRAVSAQADTRRLRLLLVDDNTEALELLAQALTSLGHEVQTAADGPTALRLAGTTAPDVAILDIGLPGMDGYQLGRLLRQQAVTRSLSIVALSGYGQRGDYARSKAEGFFSHLVKPVNLNSLQSVLREISSHGPSHDGASVVEHQADAARAPDDRPTDS